MAINPFNVSYNDFELDTIINPDEFDVNFADIEIRINQVIDVLNRITDGIGGDGTEIIDIKEIYPFVSPKLQGFLEELVERLQSSEPLSGSTFIGSSPIEGVAGTTVQEQLASLKTLFDELLQRHIDDHAIIEGRVSDVEADFEDYDRRIATFQGDVDNLTSTKADKSNTYTKAQTDTEIAHLEAQVYGDVYTKAQSDVLLDEKTDVTGNHAGTWQGLNVSDLARSIGANGVAIQTTQPTNPSERTLWFNPSNNQYMLYLNGQWRANPRPTQILKRHNRVVLDADSTSVNVGIANFNAEYDALIVMQNSVFIAEGFEYELNGSTITSTTPWKAGTTLDFIGFIATPVG